MPLISVDVQPSGQVVFNTDDILLVYDNGAGVEVKLRGVEQRVFLPHATVADATRDIRDPDNRVFSDEDAA